MVFFFVGNLVLSVLGLFLFYFCLVWGEQATDAHDFGWQSKGEDHFRSWFPFFLFTWWQFCIVQVLSGPKTSLHISSVFFWSLIGNLLFFCVFFFFLSLFDWEFSLSAFFRLFDREPSFLCFLPRARFMVSWDFGSRLRGKGDVPHYFHDTHATMMIWKFYAKLVMHAPMWTLKCQVFMVMWC